jgi:hypothetical protein
MKSYYSKVLGSVAMVAADIKRLSSVSALIVGDFDIQLKKRVGAVTVDSGNVSGKNMDVTISGNIKTETTPDGFIIHFEDADILVGDIVTPEYSEVDDQVLSRVEKDLVELMTGFDSQRNGFRTIVKAWKNDSPAERGEDGTFPTFTYNFLTDDGYVVPEIAKALKVMKDNDRLPSVYQ